MKTLIKSLFASVAVAGLLSGCATYDYGYGYSQPNYGYGYDYGPAYYGYGPTYDYGPSYGYYGPGYYLGAPTIGFDFRSRDRGRHERAGVRHDGRRLAGRSHASRHAATTPRARTGQRNRSTAVASGTRVPAAPPDRRAQSSRGRDHPGSQQQERAEQ